ncbi:diguanylate cyclase domain-containing protein [Allohahella sp. A8]|uniref:diguanylate cyclase domain-containing protein n=1 Tax=Allohahella sp. A8 TaxID=3141461 RepID=UPI003A7FDFF6
MVVTQSVQKKLVTILALCALAFVVLSAPVISYVSFNNHTRNASDQQERLVEAVSQSASIAAYVQNETIAQDVLNGLMLDDEIRYVRLLGEEGFSAESEGIPPDQTMPETHLTEHILRSPVEPHEKIGSLMVWANEPLIRRRAIDSVKNDILLLVSLSVLFSIASILAANRLVGAPLRDLARQLSQARPGSSEVIRVGAAHQQDEIGLVANSVNSFLGITREALEAERDLRLKVEKLDRHYRNIFASTHVGIVVMDENGVLLHNNPVLLERIIPLSANDRSRLPEKAFFDLAFRRPVEAWTLVDSVREQGGTASADLELVSSDGSPAWVHCIVSSSRDKDTGEQLVEAVMYDVTSRIVEASKAQRMAQEDPLTGLQNRRGCELYFERTSSQAAGMSELAAMVLDLDGFKAVNDSLGHAAGDQLLKVIAQRLQACVRSDSDLVGRFGGDEFVVILNLPSKNADAVGRIAQKILDEVSRPIPMDGASDVSVGVSIGIACSRHFPGFDQLIKAADAAMYLVKSTGKNSFQFAKHADK